MICLTAPAFGQLNMFRKTMDFDGDGKADFAVTRNIGGNKYWYIRQTGAGVAVRQFGIDTDQNAVGDFDGDGKFDIAIFRRPLTEFSSYAFWIWGSQNGVWVRQRYFNYYQNSVAHQQDYDGDGKTDVAYTEGINNGDPYFYVESSQTGETYASGSGVGTLVRLGDISGDRIADTVGYRTTSQGLVVYIRNGLNIQSFPFGLAGDQFVAADFDGDGKGDISIFRPSDGTWWWKRSSDGALHAAQFGQNGDVPVPADYDGDGKTDLAIWRPDASQSVYWVYGSLGNIMVVPFGIATDSVVTY